MRPWVVKQETKPETKDAPMIKGEDWPPPPPPWLEPTSEERDMRGRALAIARVKAKAYKENE